MGREKSGNPAISTGNGTFEAGTARSLTTILRSWASAAVGVLFSCTGGPGTAHNGGGAAGATHTNRIQKPPENRVKTAIPGVICKEGAARRRPGSHSSRPKRTSFAALEDSIADGAANGKGVRRANEALERANFARKTETSAQIGADGGVRGPCEACVASAQNRGKPGRVQSDIPGKTSKPCHFAVFPGFFWG